MSILPIHGKPPEGARCAEHPDRPATYRCPGCGRNVCSFCWNDDVSHCRTCGESGPREKASAVPFEDTSRSLPSRIVSTFAAAFRPQENALGFARCRPAFALRFLLISALPLSLISGVIPNTKTLLFGPGLHVNLVGTPADLDIVVDVLRAMVFQLLFDGLLLAALVFPFVSLARSYGRPQCASSAIGTMFYRYWLVPAAMAGSYISFWISPDEKIAAVAGFVISILALYFLIRAMWSTARIPCAVGPLWSIAVVGVPWVLSFIVVALVVPILARVLGIVSQEALLQPYI
jgi:hypothetical protein